MVRSLVWPLMAVFDDLAFERIHVDGERISLELQLSAAPRPDDIVALEVAL